MKTPFNMGFRQQPEWATTKRLWLAWPYDETLWEENLAGAQRAFLDFAQAVRGAAVDVSVLVPNAAHSRQAQMRFGERRIGAAFVEIPFGDIWLRDIAPIFVQNPQGENAAVCFPFNGWGGKYILPGDAEVSRNIAEASGLKTFSASMIFEGGALEPNGEGTALTTKQCLLNKNRNPQMSPKEISQVLRDTLGIEHLLWIEEGLHFDHTDGHIDNIARFVNPETVVCMESKDDDDPQRDVLEKILRELRAFRLPSGKALEIITVPSPGLVNGPEGEPMAASYLNFLITNKTVSVPVYMTRNDDQALKRLETALPGRKIVGIDCRDLLTGGGSLHCISQPEFSERKTS